MPTHRPIQRGPKGPHAEAGGDPDRVPESPHADAGPDPHPWKAATCGSEALLVVCLHACSGRRPSTVQQCRTLRLLAHLPYALLGCRFSGRRRHKQRQADRFDLGAHAPGCSGGCSWNAARNQPLALALQLSVSCTQQRVLCT
jgi:hypothetical protein